MAGGRDRAQAGQQVIFAFHDFPAVVAGKVIGKVAGVLALARRFQFVALNVDFAAGDVAQAPGMVEMQMANEDGIDVGSRNAEAREPGRQALVFVHVGRAESERRRIEPMRAFFRIGDLGVVAADVVEHAAIGRLDQVGEDRRLDRRAGAAIARGKRLVVAMRRGQQRPQFEYGRHAIVLRPSSAAILSLLETVPKMPPSTAIMRRAASCRSREPDAQASPMVMHW